MMHQSQVTVSLRAVSQHDLEIFFDHQLEPDATAMAGFPARGHDAHIAHWSKVLANENNITRTILANGEVAGNIGSWIADTERDIGYWIGKRFWGKGVATAAAKQFLKLVQERPLYAWVARHNLGSIRVLEKADSATTMRRTTMSSTRSCEPRAGRVHSSKENHAHRYR